MNPYERSPEDDMLYTYMENMHDDILERLSKLERAALNNDFDEFKHQWNKEQDEAQYENF